MVTPRLTGYPIDREIARRSQLQRQARRARKRPSGRHSAGLHGWWAEGTHPRMSMTAMACRRAPPTTGRTGDPRRPGQESSPTDEPKDRSSRPPSAANVRQP
jgi:hypothetical protein